MGENRPLSAIDSSPIHNNNKREIQLYDFEDITLDEELKFDNTDEFCNIHDTKIIEAFCQDCAEVLCI